MHAHVKNYDIHTQVDRLEIIIIELETVMCSNQYYLRETIFLDLETN